jgi:hypothetical protein
MRGSKVLLRTFQGQRPRAAQKTREAAAGDECGAASVRTCWKMTIAAE